ncbi:MAG: hypothetical protein IKL71_07340 [Bacteroidaceae bacterium]|nr:hypothetical protein [Bacteroidaceae bacterium]
MKKILILLVSVFALSVYNVFATSSDNPTSPQENNPQKCQFSLDHYTGKISNGHTNDITVSLSCPQDTEVSATVFVSVDGERIASQVYTIEAGKKKSEESVITVPAEYKGMKYTLYVE